MLAPSPRRIWRALLLLSIAFGWASACGVPTYHFGDAGVGGADSGTPDAPDEAATPPVPCETDLECQALGHATATCVERICQITECESGFANCNGIVADGCEADLSSSDSCGRCDNKCNSTGGTPSCDANGECQIECDAEHGDCSGGASDGCETDITVSVSNCGVCGNPCPALGATPACNNGVCGVTCAGTLMDCNGGDDGCETNLSNDVENCGGCGHNCPYPNGSIRCVNKVCRPQGCDPGFADCIAGDDGCETPLGTKDNCADCGDACTNPGGTTTCSAGLCVPSACTAGWKDCDGLVNNGCETDLHSTDNCGACNALCSFPNAQASCTTGTCTMGACTPGFANCNTAATAPGCETPLGTVTNCAGCNAGCTAQNGTNACTGAPGTYACSPVCNAGFASCDAIPSNGCETNIGTSAKCGSCTAAPCAAATPYCVSGACANPLVNTSAHGMSATAGLSFMHTLQTPRAVGSGRLVAVLIASSGNDVTAPISGVSYNSTLMTRAQGIYSGNSAYSTIYYMLDANLPSQGGSYTVAISGGASGVAANAYEFKGIDQVSPIVIAPAGIGRSNCGGAPPSDSITITGANNVFILAALALFGSNPGVAGTGQTLTFSGSTGNPVVWLNAAYRGPVPAGSYAMGWSGTVCDSSVQSFAVLRPAAP